MYLMYCMCVCVCACMCICVYTCTYQPVQILSLDLADDVQSFLYICIVCMRVLYVCMYCMPRYVCMYVCMYVMYCVNCMYVCTVCMYVFHVCMYVCIVCIHVSVCLYVCIFHIKTYIILVYIEGYREYVCMYVCMYVCVCVCVCVCQCTESRLISDEWHCSLSSTQFSRSRNGASGSASIAPSLVEAQHAATAGASWGATSAYYHHLHIFRSDR
jgi:hypothetical protein